MAGKIQITGGAFQDFEGNVLANGYLIMQLSHDEQFSYGGGDEDPDGQVVGAQARRIALDANGNIAGTVDVWPNDQLNPANSYYIVKAYRHDGVLAWLAPQFQTVTGSGPFDVGTWVPNNPPVGGAPVGSILLQTNSVNNGSQSKLNQVAGSNMTIVDDGSGGITFASTGGAAFAGSGSYFFGPGVTDPASIFALLNAGIGSGQAAGVVAANVVTVYLFQLLAQWTISKVTTQCLDNFGLVTSTFGIYSAAGNKDLDGGSFTCLASSGVQTNSITPVTLPPGLYWHAQATTSTNSPHFPGLIVASGGETPSIMAFLTQNATRAATAAHQLSAGVLPATLGTLTPFTPSNFNNDGIVCPLYE